VKSISPASTWLIKHRLMLGQIEAAVEVVMKGVAWRENSENG
jgi:hypothetical protein